MVIAISQILDLRKNFASYGSVRVCPVYQELHLDRLHLYDLD